MQKQHASGGKIKRICFYAFFIYLFLVVSFYFLAGEQLHFRESRGNYALPVADSGTVELTQGAVVTQDFAVKIQRLQTVSVQWGTFYRANSGTVLVELVDLRDGSVLLSQSYDAAAITDGGFTTLTSPQPIETVYDTPLQLRITADSLPGSAVTPLMATTVSPEDFALTMNGAPTAGSLCFTVSGQDYIWTGLHYWQFAAALGAVIALYLLAVYKHWKRGKKSLLVNAVAALKKYNFLIKQLVSRDFKSKYKRSVLGVFWSFLNPLLTMIVQYAVFSNLFRFDIPHYQVYLLCGIILFNFFSEACTMTLLSIVGNAGLITKVYMPKYIYPLTRTVSSLTNFLIALLPLFVVTLASGVQPSKAWLLLPFVVICLTVFTLGAGMLLATAMVFFRDVQFLWGVLSMVWMYLTPIFYPESILPESIAWVLKCNPLYYYVTFTRTLIIDGVSPEPVVYAQCALFALGTLLVGAFVFKKNQDKFVLYL
ncbi:ABC transporter permease [Oscillibacter sp.]|uniref:ABC transporter permease n=1 Tax=Oscillibacter sp. TaxID=1945593 RepID=UPI0028990302|nr:ABC transporter permease [Oscillibacter sp.]